MKNFKLTLDGISYKVSFRHYNNRVVYCRIYVPEMNKVFISKALCNVKEGDTYYEATGEMIAFGKAFNKIESVYRKIRKSIHQDLSFCNHIVITHFTQCSDKLITLQNKIAQRKK